MSQDDGLFGFAAQVRDDVTSTAADEADEAFAMEAFTRYVIGVLTEAGELNDGDVCFHQSRGVETSGWGFSDDQLTLNVFVTIYTQSVPPQTVGRTVVDTAFRRLSTMVQRCLHGLYRELEEASPVFDMAQRIYAVRDGIAAVRLFVFTDGLTTVDVKPDEEIDGRPTSFHVWDLRRLFRCVTSGQHREPIQIDFVEEFGQAIPCLSASQVTGDYRAYLAVFPGQILSAIYERYGARLLELNVRSFLQARGKVNQGIRTTILNEPDRFLAYNNGISSTASSVTVVPMNGGSGIKSVSDFQVVNGGQTTASLYQAFKRDRADLSNIFVQAKLTVVSAEEVAAFVPLVSRYANSQNKVNEADFSANDPFHVELEKSSRTVWAPAADGTQRLTQWFYERARGQYQDAMNREGTPARQRQWKSVHPPQQRFTKTDLAKYENTWAGLPHVVSLGAEKNFREFTIRLPRSQAGRVDLEYFQDLVAKAILFRRTEKLVGAQNFGGYRANIVTYSLAKLLQLTVGRIDLRAIWQRQDASANLQEALVETAKVVHGIITNPPGGGNVTEWCKKEACWERVRAAPVTLPRGLGEELLTAALVRDRAEAVITPALRMVSDLEEETWQQMLGWISETASLEGWHRAIAFQLRQLKRQGRSMSHKQLEQGLQVVLAARDGGFRPAQEPLWDTVTTIQEPEVDADQSAVPMSDSE
jgi:hypothetical protein